MNLTPAQAKALVRTAHGLPANLDYQHTLFETGLIEETLGGHQPTSAGADAISQDKQAQLAHELLLNLLLIQANAKNTLTAVSEMRARIVEGLL